MKTTKTISILTTLGLIMGVALLASGCREAPASEALPQQLTAEEVEPAIRVRAAEVGRESFDQPVALSGVARANRRAMLTTDVPGRVTERTAEVGDEVDEGDVLLRLDTRHIRLDVEAARANVAARQTDVQYANQELQRAEQLFEAGAQTGRVRDQAAYNAQKATDGLRIARATQAKAVQALRDTQLRAPFTGVVAECQVDQGDTVAPGRPVIGLVDLSQVKVVVGVTAADAAQLEAGQAATVTFEALGGAALTGQLHHIGPSLDRTSGTYPAEFRVDNPDGRIREGMVAHVSLPAQPRQSLTVPQSAIIRVGGAPAVYVITGEGGAMSVERREVRLGASSEGRTEVLRGLDEGDRVVTEGLFALSDGARVEIDGSVE